MMRWFSGMFLLVALNAYAVAPKQWTVTSPEEFLAGESEGVAITSLGDLRPAPAVTKLASFTDPFVLSQTSDAAGNRYFGTGNAGRLYRLNGKELKVLFTAPEPEIYALAHHDGALLVGTSPNGKVYRVDPSSGASSEFFDPKQAFIWAIEPTPQGVVVATGVEGKLFRVDRSGKGSEIFDAPETHLRSVAAMGDGRLLVGGSGEGRIYEVSANGKGRALYDSNLTEITAVYWDSKTNTGWAAGVANVLPTTAPPKSEPQKTPAGSTTQPSTTQGGAGEQKKQDDASVSVEVSYSFDEGAASSSGASPGAELYRIASDGFVETVRRFDREVIYALAGSDNGGVLLSTGPLGRVYEMRDNNVALIASVPEKQVVSFSRSGGSYIVTTTNAGAVYELATNRTGKGEYRSIVKDAERFSDFGHYEVRGNVANSGLAVAFRSGNTNTPDDTWSDWSVSKGASGEIEAPRARFLQWRVSFDNPRPETSVDAVTVAFVNRNVAPKIDALAVLEPGVILVSSNYPAAPGVVEATNPDEYGIFSSLENPRDRQDPGKRMFRRGYRTVAWKARDENGDTLRYDVNFRARGANRWLRLRHNIEENQINFDTSQLPDGEYEVQVVASDAEDNPQEPLTEHREGALFFVDNTSPRINSQRDGGVVVVQISDELSAIGKVEYSIDAEKWERLTPVDGISDSRSETFRIPAKDGAFVMVRAVDGQYNVATAQLK